MVVAAAAAIRVGVVWMRRRRYWLGRRRRPVRRLLVRRVIGLHFLHLQDVGVAELPAQAADQADRVDAVADHLQLVLVAAGDLHGDYPCTGRHCESTDHRCDSRESIERLARTHDDTAVERARTVCSGGQRQGFGPAPIARHAHLDHRLLLQQEHRRTRRINVISLRATAGRTN